MMEGPMRREAFLPTIKCSNCGWDIELALMSQHVCSRRSPANPPFVDAARLQYPMDSATGHHDRRGPYLHREQPQPEQRSFPQRNDLFAAGRPTLPYAGEVTPTSSGQGSIHSPMSATSGRSFPGQGFRKGSIPGPRGPPSPELTNLDCAFPPFPNNTPRSAASNREIQTVRHKEQGENPRSRGESGTNNNRSSQQLDKEPILRRSASMGPPRQRSKTLGGYDKHAPTPTTAPSRMPSNFDAAADRKPSREAVPPVPSKSPSLKYSPQGTESTSLAPNYIAFGAVQHSGGPIRALERRPPWDEPLRPSGSAEHELHNQERRQNGATTALPDNGLSKLTGAYRSKSAKEPNYKAKRPPPLVSSASLSRARGPDPSKVRSPTVPPPNSGGMLSRSITKIFGRGRSQSTSAQREMVRQALSDEPVPVVATPDLPRGMFEQPRPAPSLPEVAISPLMPPMALVESAREREESLRALEGANPADRPWPSVAEPSSEATQSDTQARELLCQDEPTKPILHCQTEPRHEQQLRRASIDSSSSYGSVGFTDRSASSRSSPPPMDELVSNLAETMYSEVIPPPLEIVPKPLRTMADLTLVESPKDLLFSQEHQSTNYQPTHLVCDSPPVDDAVQDPSSNSDDEDESSMQRLEAVLTGSHALAPNKGICPGCSTTILLTQKSVSSADGRLTGRYHKRCFVCHACKSPFPTAEFYVHSDHPYCAHHYHELANSLCTTCGKGIEGLYMETANVAGRGKEKHHPQCLKCSTCHVQLTHDYFELSGKVYCERDAFRIASLPKAHDRAPTRPSPLVREYISSGDPGLLQGTNFPERRVTKLMTMI